MTETTADGNIGVDDNTATNDPKKEDFKDRLSDIGVWQRLGFMALFGVIGYFAFWTMILLAIVQFIFHIISDEPNDDLVGFSGNLSTFLMEIAAYMTFVSDDKPFPFGPFPKETSGKGTTETPDIVTPPAPNPTQD